MLNQDQYMSLILTILPQTSIFTALYLTLVKKTLTLNIVHWNSEYYWRALWPMLQNTPTSNQSKLQHQCGSRFVALDELFLQRERGWLSLVLSWFCLLKTLLNSAWPVPLAQSFSVSLFNANTLYIVYMTGFKGSLPDNGITPCCCQPGPQ